VSFRLPIPPDPIPLREALRGLRHVLRRGGASVAEAVSSEVLPKPAADLAGAVLESGRRVVHGAGSVAAGVARTVLGAEPAPAPAFDGLIAQSESPAKFAAAAYAALKVIVVRLGAGRAFVSEASALQAYRRARPALIGATAPQAAAALALALTEARVIRSAPADGHDGRGRARTVEPLAVFALLLWWLSPRPEEDGEAALEAAADIAAVLEAEVAEACARRDEPALAALFERYAAHV
jgi:hypothetical protein